jgi:hypothetical protein
VRVEAMLAEVKAQRVSESELSAMSLAAVLEDVEEAKRSRQLLEVREGEEQRAITLLKKESAEVLEKASRKAVSSVLRLLPVACGCTVCVCVCVRARAGREGPRACMLSLPLACARALARACA